MPFLAGLSAYSLPKMPQWEGTQQNVTSDPLHISKWIRCQISFTMKWGEMEFEHWRECKTDFESTQWQNSTRKIESGKSVK